MSTLDRLEARSSVDRWLLRGIRDRMKFVVQHDLVDEALRICKLIRKHDLLIAAPAPPDDHAMRLPKNRHASVCQRRVCMMTIPQGVVHTHWVANVGSWHPECWALDRAEGRPEAQLPVRDVAEAHPSLWEMLDGE